MGLGQCRPGHVMQHSTTFWRCVKSHFPPKLKLDGIADPPRCFTVGPMWVGTILVFLGPNKSLVLVAFPQLWFLSSYLTIKMCTVEVEIYLQLELCMAFIWALIWSAVNLWGSWWLHSLNWPSFSSSHDGLFLLTWPMGWCHHMDSEFK